MKIKVLSNENKTADGRTFTGFFTPVTIMVKGEEDKGVQEKTLTVKFSETAQKKLPIKFKSGIIECKGEDVVAPYVYEIKQKEDGKPDYPFVTIKDFISVSPLPQRENTCTFLIDEQETEESEM